MRPEITKNTYIAMDPNAGKVVTMNIDITFPNAPCFCKDYQFFNKNYVNSTWH